MAYSAQRKRNLYTPGSDKPFKLSRSKIELFMDCPRCFYLDRRVGIARPPGFPFNLNSAVDALLKNEFDLYREQKTVHPLMVENHIEAIPFQHSDLDKWRANFTGVQFLHEPTGLLLFGAVDDVWIDTAEQLLVVDYKSTSKSGEVTLDAQWQDSYKRQMEIYQWLLRRNNFKVSDTGWFVYCNGSREAARFDACLKFDITLLSYTGKDDWIEPVVQNIHECLNSDTIPNASGDCDYCAYTEAISALDQSR